MAILIDENTTYLIQGITGKQGQVTCKEMLDSGSKVVCGVTPGKGGEQIFGIPIYNSVKQAKEYHKIDASLIYVPPRFAKSAVIEAIEADIPLINIITENIPVHDIAYCLSLAEKHCCKIIGPSSAGIYSVGKSKCGSIAGGKSKKAFIPGTIGIISKSGGMSSETSLVLKNAGLGQSTVVSVGGDVLCDENFKELAQLFEKDLQTEGIAIFGEIGGSAEEDLAKYLIKRREQNNPFKKPIAAFISGDFAKNFPNITLGHAGAIINEGKGTKENKVKSLKQAGVLIADVHHHLGEIIKKAVEENK